MSVDTSSTNATAYPVEQDKPATAPLAEAEAGVGGGEMRIWYKDRSDQLNTLITADFTDYSAFTLPDGVVDTLGYPTSWETSEEPLSAPGTTATTGSGGGIMDIWEGGTRDEQLRSLVTAALANLSAYTLPDGVVDTLGYSTAFEANEEGLSQPPKGARLGPNYYNLLIEGRVEALPPSSEEEPITITDAEITAEQDGREQTFTTTPREDGTYGLSVDEYGTWTITARRRHLKPATREIAVDEKTEIGNDLTLRIPSGSAGLQISQGVRLG